MKVLLIVDVQEVFMVTPELKQLPNKINNLILNGSFDYVVATRFINRKNSCFVQKWGWKKAMTNDIQSQINPLILSQSDYTFIKFGFSCYTASFKKILKLINFNIKKDKIYVCGLDTDLCVQSTCSDLFIHNFDVYVLSRLCGSDAGVQSHEAGLMVLRHMLGNNRIIDIFDKNTTF